MKYIAHVIASFMIVLAVTSITPSTTSNAWAGESVEAQSFEDCFNSVGTGLGDVFSCINGGILYVINEFKVTAVLIGFFIALFLILARSSLNPLLFVFALAIVAGYAVYIFIAIAGAQVPLELIEPIVGNVPSTPTG